MERLTHLRGNEVHHSESYLFATQRNELVVWDNCNKHFKNQSDIAGNYQLPASVSSGSVSSREYLAGAYNFCVEEIEVF